mmetsp:Transcript_4961/g.7514  ORF Transcript_4961/g.7514 Transcript_4961/m.7514 type:complete len:172 (-) Transcript_4961:156-671(-)|eukprot:CAMPEP_0113943520 /NCGR_PEP_ID=MMETSP1339-20121228/25589_1 /TAXON_ID=94617 /ORGANISM="Fibrocapsa japonica" /LENGTH=171 /DNA_ID=CAMNT_0000948419 /DNA_START=66 /DNA_END=581 /DNA_ORIENTATION=+ /assembly_acc=CAM_ASM_000762
MRLFGKVTSAACMLALHGKNFASAFSNVGILGTSSNVGLTSITGLPHKHSPNQFVSRYSQIRKSVFSTNAYPVSLVVTVEIEEDRVEEFLKVIEADAIGSRTKENGGCLRFDVLRDLESSNKFTFYEVYKDNDAVAYHKSTDHFKLWTDFKATGAVKSQSVIKAEALFYTE